MLMQELVEVKDNCICLKEDALSINVETNDDLINNILVEIGYHKYKPVPNDKKHLKDYRLSILLMGSKIYKLIIDTFSLDANHKITIFDVPAIESQLVKPMEIEYSFTWTEFEMGSPSQN